MSYMSMLHDRANTKQILQRVQRQAYTHALRLVTQNGLKHRLFQSSMIYFSTTSILASSLSKRLFEICMLSLLLHPTCRWASLSSGRCDTLGCLHAHIHAALGRMLSPCNLILLRPSVSTWTIFYA